MVIGLLLDDTLDRSDGVQQAVLAIGKELERRKHEVHYIVPETERDDITNLHSIGKSLSLQFNGNSVRTPLPIKTKDIVELFSEVKFDVLHVQMPYSPIFSARILNNAPKSVKKFGTFHILPYNNWSKYGTKLLSTGLSKSLKSFNNVFAVSRPANVFMHESFGIKGVVLPNPVDYEYFHSFKKKKTDKKQIVFVGRFEQRKGVEELIQALSLLPKVLLKQTDITMCGKGPLLEKVKQEAKDKSLDINFPGFVNDDQKAQFLANADIAVFPSISGESFGIVLTEAMSAGSGVTLGGNNPGYSSVLENYPETLFDPKDIPEFANTIKKYLENDKKRLEVGKKQHSEVKQYDIKVVTDKLLEHYKND